MEKKNEVKNAYKNPYCDYTLLFGDTKKKKVKKSNFKVKKFDFNKAIKENEGLRLDIACGEAKQEGFIGIDARPMPGVDIVWNLENFPWPLPDNCIKSAVASHYIEHINPANFGLIKFFNETWRVMKPNGRLMIACPYGVSRGFMQDPTHTKPIIETTFEYLDPCYPSGLWAIYQPSPWKIIAMGWHLNGNLEVVLQKMPKEDVVVENNHVIVDSKWANVKSRISNSDKQ